jgi:hypothetical protein
MKTLIVDLSSCSSSSLLLLSDKLLSVKTFFSFENSEIMINNLINRFLIHSLVLSQTIPFQTGMKIDSMKIDQIDTEINQNTISLQISLKNDHFLNLIHISMTKIDSFIYMIIDRYIFERFYKLMIDSSASRTFIAKYEQYLAFKKNDIDFFTDLNINKTDAVHVQFKIESI